MGDMLHAKGRALRPRRALSARVVFSKDAINVDRILSGGPHKLSYIWGNHKSFVVRMGFIRAMGQRELTYRELAKTKSCAGGPSPTCKLPRWRLRLADMWSNW